MNSYDIAACIISAFVIIGLIAVFVIYVFWKRCRKWFAVFPTKKGHKIGFSIGHGILFGLSVVYVATGAYLDSNSDDTIIESRRLIQEVKNEANILNTLAINAEKKLSHIPKMSMEDAINKTLIYTTMEKDLKKDFSFDFPERFNFYQLLIVSKRLEDEQENKTTCEPIREKISMPHYRINKIDDFFPYLRQDHIDYLEYFQKKMNAEYDKRANELDNELEKMNKHGGKIRMRLTKDWKTAVVQIGRVVDRKTKKVDGQEVSNILSNIGLWYIPLGVILIFVISSILLQFTDEKSRKNRCLFILTHIMFYVIVLLTCTCAGYIVHKAIVGKNEESIPEVHPKFFDFQIPLYDGHKKSSFEILSKSSGKLFDLPNDDILIGKIEFFDNLEKELVQDLEKLKQEEECRQKNFEKISSAIDGWNYINYMVSRLNDIKSNNVKECDSSLPVIDAFLAEFNKTENVTKTIEILTANYRAWERMGVALRTLVKQKSKDLKDLVEKRKADINEGINILSIDCKSTMATMNKIHKIGTAHNVDENKKGIMILLSCFVLLNLFACEVSFLYTYRKFGPDELIIIYDGRLAWIEGVLKSSCAYFYANYREIVSKLKITEVLMERDDLKPFESTLRCYLPCIKSTRVLLKNMSIYKYFVHANYIPLPNAELQNDGWKKSKYIAASSPVKEGIFLFLHMLYNEKVNVVLMLCRFVEDGHEECAQYYSEKLGKTLSFGEYSMKLVDIKKSAFKEFTWRVLELSCGTDKRTINHIQYTEWPENSIPENPQSVLAMMNAASDLYNDAPILVHCNDGIGRTGTLIAIDYISESLKSFADVSLIENMRQLRNLRYGFVGNAFQFLFLYHALLRKFTKDELVADERCQCFYIDYERFRRSPEFKL
ncbi:unnamed protein product [Caenorhabditis angaria]|uniref:Protein-tyrosine-phosphatase n=1 Tax=Caenorhabditis angaria TaxID=860376 RepID=A0A9P1IEG9_9PELO|nr:unnamed protein product [Caenorhabditis angaria]